MPKYTDKDIKKALECCIHWKKGNCTKCPIGDKCLTERKPLLKAAHDLINRQEAEKAELQREIANCNAKIERLQRILDSYALQYGTAVDKDVLLKQTKSEAIKEFAERLKEKAKANEWNGTICGLDIDNLKEMVGESNG